MSGPGNVERLQIQNARAYLYWMRLRPGQKYNLNEGREPYGVTRHSSCINFGCCAGELKITHETAPVSIHVPEEKFPYDGYFDLREKGVIENNLPDKDSEYFCFGPRDVNRIHSGLERILLPANLRATVVSPGIATVLCGVVEVGGRTYGPATLFTIENTPQVFTAQDDIFLAICYDDETATRVQIGGSA